MTKGVITYQYKHRLVDKITVLASKMHLFKQDGYYPIIEEVTKREVGAFLCIQGSKPIVKLLEVITDYRGKDVVKHNIEY